MLSDEDFIEEKVQKPTTYKSVKEVEKVEETKSSPQQEKESFNKIFQYAKKEKCLFFSGIIFLLLGCVGDFVTPLYIGLVIDALVAGNYDLVGPYCL